MLVDELTIYSAVDQKPKSTQRLRRLDNIDHNPIASLLVDHYDDDWSRLWWVRVDGAAQVLRAGHERLTALGQLADKYEQYRAAPPQGAVIAITLNNVRSWP